MGLPGKPPQRTRRYSPKRLRERPVEIPTCQGTVVVSAEIDAGRLQVRIAFPLDNAQPNGKDTP